MRPQRGKAWVFEGILDVDWEICPYSMVRDLKRAGMLTYEELGKYCMIKVDPDFPKKVAAGDFIVGERNMGYGHDHDHASMSIRGAGVAAVVCESSAPYFLRNSIDHGLPVVEVPGIFAEIGAGDELELDLAQGTLRNLTSGRSRQFKPYPAFILRMLSEGGLYPMLKREVQAGRYR